MVSHAVTTRLLLSSILLSTFASSKNCDGFDPIVLNIGTCSMASGTAGIDNIGLVAETGENSLENPDSNQQCLNLAFSFQNTILMSSTVCSSSNLEDNDLKDWTEDTCRTIKGGFYTSDNSKTRSAANLEDLAKDAYYNKNIDPEIQNPFRDRLAIQGLTISNFSMGLITSGKRHNTGFIGLGSDSTFLETLKCGSSTQPRKLGCRCLGIDMGSSDFNRTRDGSVILGGYNRKAVTGQFEILPISKEPPKSDRTRPCPLKVTINKLDLILPGQPDIPLSTFGTPMPACIEPYDTHFRFPNQIVEAFKQKSNHTANPQSRKDPDLIIPEPGLLYDTENNPFLGSLRFEISGTDGTPLPPVTIRNSNLAGPLSGFKNGKRAFQDNLSEVKILDIKRVNDTVLEDTAILGKVFLSQVYLAVNYDIDVFGLALISDGAGNAIEKERLPDGLASCNDKGCESGGGGLSRKQTVGIAVGVPIAFLVLSAILAFAWWWIRYRRQPRDNDDENTPTQLCVIPKSIGNSSEDPGFHMASDNGLTGHPSIDNIETNSITRPLPVATNAQGSVRSSHRPSNASNRGDAHSAPRNSSTHASRHSSFGPTQSPSQRYSSRSPKVRSDSYHSWNYDENASRHENTFSSSPNYGQYAPDDTSYLHRPYQQEPSQGSCNRSRSPVSEVSIDSVVGESRSEAGISGYGNLPIAFDRGNHF